MFPILEPFENKTLIGSICSIRFLSFKILVIVKRKYGVKYMINSFKGRSRTMAVRFSRCR